ncbi:MAG: Spy/CpxP family protein refolding chaperone [Deltaproteobacteria bacterium]|nr:Spy/CpxP family protein refolding chaperone [Deltaproteobacteria bacterium]
MKKIIAIVGILALAAVISIPVLAQGPGSPRGRGMTGPWAGDPGAAPRYPFACDKLTDEQRNQLGMLQQKHFDETAEVRSQMWAKKAELNVMMNTSNPDLEKAKALQKEISDLRAKMAQERINIYAEAKKISPDLRFGRSWGRGKGLGPCDASYGQSMGRGWQRGGYGHGPCWN